MQFTSLGHVQSHLNAGGRMVEVVDSFLARIEAHSQLNVFLEVFSDEVRAQAQAQDALSPEEKAQLPLLGLVLAIKDNIAFKGHRMSAGSRMLQTYTSPFTATALQRLLDAGAVVIGRVNCDEFAMGSSNEKSFYGPVLNPLDPQRVPGGSSGGSAAAVAAGLCVAALGTDTGGSIRQPAAFCGVVGMKPSYGRVSRYGLLAYGSSFDQIGPLTHTVKDAETILAYMAGSDPQDSTSMDATWDAAAFPSKPLKLVLLKEAMEFKGMNPQVKLAFEQTLNHWKAQGHSIEERSFPLLESLVPTYYVLSTAEASSNLGRYDGIHYGFRSPDAEDLESTYRLSRSQGFGPEVKRRIMTGTFVLSSKFFDAYYLQAQRVRRKIREATDALLQGADALVLPTSPNLPFKFGEKDADPIAMYMEDAFTVQANLAGNPAISLPISIPDSPLYASAQLMAARGADEALLHMSMQLMPGE
ncbi:MAG: Asp-tRNA(Asn)/Glu-tRNA(Gln) amidotransferase subunit GatA [Bacteroidetes bacterium]|jgi:aspartyl-tRNA(Asn)/glutamyl-tRNA(Gln) amidotransferase subunit A|nr:Asp-tRNA(Asn)/Glu-tRNA(Gln) amidotransferase subunit GatA [Bacteroidota bacterium]